MSTENLLAEVSKVDVVTVGQRLRAARQQLNYTQQQVAQRLYLKLVVIQRIEDGITPEDLHSTFMRGYIRSYGRLVKVPEDELLPRYSPTGSGQVYRALRQTVSHRRRLWIKEDHLALWSWLVLFSLLVLTVVWWWQQRLGSGDSMMEDIVPDSGISALFPPESTPSSYLKEPTAELTMLHHEQPATLSDGVTVELQEPLTVMSQSQSQPRAQLQPALRESKHSRSVQPEIRVTFSEKSWLEVRDREHILFTGVRGRGETLLLSGQPPYQLTIGVPEVVHVHYHGRDVTLKPHITPQSRVAHLTLTEE